MHFPKFEGVELKIIVIGDSCTDVFVYCLTERLAPDLPIPVLKIEEEVRNPGMSMNVVENLRGLGLETAFITNSRWSEVTKTRFVDSKTNHTFLRVDNVPEVSESWQFDESQIENYQAVVISDYDKGFLTEAQIESICASHPLVFLDTKKPVGDWAREANFIKINEREFERSRGIMSSAIQDKTIQTLGANGAVFKGMHFPVNRVEVRDSTGAGDSFLAGFVYEYLKTGDASASIKFANKCASEVVKRKGVVALRLGMF